MSDISFFFETATYINKACQAQVVLAKLQQYKQLKLLIPNQQQWKTEKAGKKAT
jgi:hypothetical protein